MASIVGGFIGSLLLPCGGLFIGGLIGAIVGFLASTFFVEDKIRQKIADAFAQGDVNKLDPENLHKEALKKLNASERTTKEQLIEIRKAYVLALHPDKNTDCLDEESTKRMLECESAFRIIEGYRKANGNW